MNIYVNNKKLFLPPLTSLKEALEHLKPSLKELNIYDCFAISINQKFIPRSLYTVTRLQEGDCIEFILPMQGG